MTDTTDRRPELEELVEAECLRLITPGGIGRLAYLGRYGPTVLPVNYRLYDGTIVFRTAQDSPADEDLRRARGSDGRPQVGSWPYGGGWVPLTRDASPATLPCRRMAAAAPRRPARYLSRKSTVTRATTGAAGPCPS
jgi:Pyridoxamine 5'-phosphate oxidase